MYVSSNRLRIIGIFCVTLCLTSCGNIPLGQVLPQPGKTREQMQSDILYCKDQAALAATTAARQTEDFLLGATLIGLPIANSMDAKAQRDAFAPCMNSRGYNVQLPDGRLASSTETGNLVTPIPVQGAENVKVDLPSEFESRPVTDAMRAQHAVYYAIDRTSDVGVLLSVGPHAGITDMQSGAASIRAVQMSLLTNSSSTDISHLIVLGRPAYRFETTGVTGNIRVTYLVTVIEGSNQIVALNCWTSAANFEKMKPMMSDLAEHVSGIQ